MFSLRGGTLDTTTHAIIDSSKGWSTETRATVEEVILFCGGNSLAHVDPVTCMNQLLTLVDQVQEVFPDAKIRLLDLIPRLDNSEDDIALFKKLITDKYSINFLIPLQLTKDYLQSDGTHVKEEGLLLVCDALKNALGIEGDDRPLLVSAIRDTVPRRASKGHRVHARQGQGPRRPHKAPIIRGARSPADGQLPVAAAGPRRMHLAIKKLSANCTADLLRSHIGDGVLGIEPMPSGNNQSKSFHVILDESRYEEVFSAAYWPRGVEVSRYNFPRH